MAKLDAFMHLLGKVPDKRLAEMAGCAESTVATARRKAGIVATGAPPAPQPPAADPPAAHGRPTAVEAEAELARMTEGASSAGEARAMLEAAGAEVVEAPPADNGPAPAGVRVTRTFDAFGPDRRWTHYGFRSFYKGALAAWLWEHHRDRVEAWPPTPAG